MASEKKSIKKRKVLPALELEDCTFEWNAKPADVEKSNPDSSSSEDEDSEKRKKCSSKRKAEDQKRLSELKVREKEEELMRLEENPETPDQFDRLLLGSPNNSELWIKYMSFHAQNTEFEKVRAVAYKALQTIDIRKEHDKLNIWIALLNVENLYGTKDSLNKCLEEAVRVNDDYQIYSKLLDIYVASNKTQEIDQLVNKVSKKFKHSLDCWLHCAECLFKVREQGKARFILQRALTCLPKKEHVTFISRFALLENKFGSSQEAQTLFEHILTSYPARVDIWSCYVDLLVKSNSLTIAGQILERACSQKLPPKKMKTLFMKRIAFEEKFGNEKTIQNVKKEAQTYVSSYSKTFDCE